MAALAQFDPRANYAVGPNLAGWMNLGFRINDGRGVNGHSAKSTFLTATLDRPHPWHAAPTGRSRPLRPPLYLRRRPSLRGGRRSSARPGPQLLIATDLPAPPDAGNAPARYR